MCPRLPCPPSTEPANRDGLQLVFKFSLSLALSLSPQHPSPTHTPFPDKVNLSALLSNSGHDPPALQFVSAQCRCCTRRSTPAPPVTSSQYNYRHSPRDYSAPLSLPANCHWNLIDPMDAEHTENTGVYTRRLTHISHVPPLPVGAFHTDSDGVVTTLSIRRYCATCNTLKFQSAAASTYQTN